MYDKLPVMVAAMQRMDWAARRNELIAENVANANTPKYLPKDVKKFEFKAMVEQVVAPPLATTHPVHVSIPMPPPLVEVETTRKPYESTPNGNGVILEEQMSKLSDTKSAYNMAATMMEKQMKMFRLALGKPG